MYFGTPQHQHMSDTTFEPGYVNRLIRSRRSTFVDQFDAGRKIPDEIIWELLKNANHAPTHKLTEPWRFTVFTGDGLITYAKKQADIYQQFAGSAFKQGKYEKLLTSPQQCSHIVAIALKRHAEIPEMEEIAAVACAVENIYLSCTAYGIGGYWTTGGVTFMPAAKEWLGLDDDDLLMGFFMLGYPKIPSPHRTPGDVRQKVTWVKE